MGIYVWGTGCGASELTEAGLAPERITAFVDSFPGGETFLGKPVLLPEQLNIADCDLLVITARHAEAISRRGRAKANDRTMLDALLHAADAMEQCQTDDVVQLLKAGWEGACRGAEATKQMLPRLGRSKNFRTHVLGYPDPGAVSTSIIFQGLYEAVSNKTIA